LDAELYFRGDGYAVVKLEPRHLSSLASHGLTWRVLSTEVPEKLYYFMAEEGAPPLGSLDVLVLDESEDGALVTAGKEAVSDAREKGYKALPLEKPWPIRKEGFLGLDFIHDTVLVDPDYRWILGSVSADTLEAYIQHLQDYGTRYTNSPQILKAGEWLLKRLYGFGYSDTLLQSVKIGDPKIKVAPGNVVATKRGATRPNFHILVGGHYDSISDALASGRAPGADDNASGTAAALEIARVLTDTELDASVQFVLFTAEEIGLVGSGMFVAELESQGIPTDELFFINMDMIGNSVSVPWKVKLFYDDRSEPLAGLAAAVGTAYTDVSTVFMGPSGRSDHFPFWQAGYPALFFHEHDFSPHYHSAHDLLEYLNMDYEAEVVRTVLATVLHLANIADPPDVVSATETIEGGVLVEWSRSNDADVTGYHLEVLDGDGDLIDKIFTKEMSVLLPRETVEDDIAVRVRAEDVLGEGEPSESVLIGGRGSVAALATPNPTSGPCSFSIFVPGSGPSVGVSLRVVDVSGRLVRSMDGVTLGRGTNTMDWDGDFDDGTPVPPGVYFYEIDAAGVGRETGRIMVVR
jgi:hypothetical protein